MIRPRHLLDPHIQPVLAPSTGALALSTASAALSGLTGLAAIWCIVQAVEDPSAAWVIRACAAWSCTAFLTAASAWVSHSTEARFEARLRRRIAGHILRIPADRLSTWPEDRLRRLVSDDVAALHHMVAHAPAEVATLLVTPLCAALLLVALAGPAALFALIPGVVAALTYLTVIPRLSATHGAERVRIMGAITAAVNDYARGIRVFRSNGAVDGARADYAEATGRFATSMTAWVRRAAVPAAVAVGLLQAPASYAVAYAVGAGWDTSTLAAVLLLSLALVTPALRLGHGLDYVTAGRTAAGRIGELLAEPTLDSGSKVVRSDDGSPDLVAARVSARRGDRVVVFPTTFRAPSGAVTAVTGPSGAGKSTLLRMIAGLEHPDGGTLEIGGVRVDEVLEHERPHTALLIPQGADVLPSTVRDNLSFTAPDRVPDRALNRALNRARLDIPLDADAGTLSGGERQRLGLARAFLADAPVILLDEPTSALDADTARRVWSELEDLAHGAGKAVIVVTHDPALAGRADHRVTLNPLSQSQEEHTR